jgi:hypothetical protein
MFASKASGERWDELLESVADSTRRYCHDSFLRKASVSFAVRPHHRHPGLQTGQSIRVYYHPNAHWLSRTEFESPLGEAIYQTMGLFAFLWMMILLYPLRMIRKARALTNRHVNATTIDGRQPPLDEKILAATSGVWRVKYILGWIIGGFFFRLGLDAVIKGRIDSAMANESPVFEGAWAYGIGAGCMMLGGWILWQCFSLTLDLVRQWLQRRKVVR